jgi:hypothetical protein
MALAGAIFLSYVSMTTMYLTRTGRTPGARIAGLEHEKLGGASVNQIVYRQMIFALWAIPNLLWLLPALIPRLLTRKPGRSPFYDRLVFKAPKVQRASSATR